MVQFNSSKDFDLETYETIRTKQNGKRVKKICNDDIIDQHDGDEESVNDIASISKFNNQDFDDEATGTFNNEQQESENTAENDCQSAPLTVRDVEQVQDKILEEIKPVAQIRTESLYEDSFMSPGGKKNNDAMTPKGLHSI